MPCRVLMGQKGVGDYATTPRDYYTSENIRLLPGAEYPDDDSKYRDPLFAFAINTKLHRKNEDGKKQEVLSHADHPSEQDGAFFGARIAEENKAM